MPPTQQTRHVDTPITIAIIRSLLDSSLLAGCAVVPTIDEVTPVTETESATLTKPGTPLCWRAFVKAVEKADRSELADWTFAFILSTSAAVAVML